MMQVAQTGHTLPIAHSSKQLIGSGMNKTLAYLISDDFAFKAKKDGRVAKIDNVNNLVILQYIDGTKDAIDLQTKLDACASGFYIHQQFKLVYAEGESFKAGDVLAYNPNYFTGKGKNVDYCPGELAKVAIAAGDFAFEDSTLISESLTTRCAAKINLMRPIVLSKHAVVHSLVNVGDVLENGDNFIEFMDSYDDPDTAEFMKRLQGTLSDDELKLITYDNVSSKHSGEITQIQVFYNCPFEELSESLQDIVKKYKGKITSREKAIEGIYTGSVKIPPSSQVNNRKIGKAEFPEEGGVIINVWIEYEDVMGLGDKITYSTALKGTISRVLKKEEAPIDEDDPDHPIEAILTPSGIISRMTSDIYSMLFGNKVLINLGQQIREIWRGER